MQPLEGIDFLKMDLSKLEICFLAGTLGQGGAERQLFYVLRALRQAGANVRLLCLTQSEFWEDRIKNLGIPIVYIGQQKSKLKRLCRIMTELRKHPPQIFQSQHFYTSAYVGIAARLLGLGSIGALRSDGLNESRDSGVVGSLLSLRVPELIVANSQTAIRYAMENGVRSERLYFLRNVVDTGLLKPGPSRNTETVRLIAVGSLFQCKRFDRFLSTLARLRREVNTQVTGVIVGAGHLRADLEDQANALGLLPSAVEFAGSIADMSTVYREADICVLTSDYEGTPNVLLEAMASGLPVVATEVGGVPEIVQPGVNGFMTRPGDDQGLFEALARLIVDSQTRKQMGKSARAYVETNHSLDALPAMLHGLYRLLPTSRAILTS